MKLEPELVREILLELEKAPLDCGWLELELEGRTDEEIIYHVMLLYEAGLIEAVDLTTLGGICWKPRRMTYAGHQFLDAARSDTVWHKAKEFSLKTTGTLTLEAMKFALPHALQALIKAAGGT